METKTNRAVSLFQAGDLRGSLGIFSTFKIGFSQSERRIIQIAHESLGKHSSFYEQLGINTSVKIEQAKKLIATKYKL